MRTRIVMDNQDKDKLRLALVDGLTTLGAQRDLAERAATTGSVPIFMFMSKWICHNTDYPQTKTLTKEQFFKSFYAWIHYKATSEKLEAKDITGAIL